MTRVNHDKSRDRDCERLTPAAIAPQCPKMKGKGFVRIHRDAVKAGFRVGSPDCIMFKTQFP
jgi:hypothetical protein